MEPKGLLAPLAQPALLAPSVLLALLVPSVLRDPVAPPTQAPSPWFE